MPQLSDVNNCFQNIDNVSVDNLLVWLKGRLDPKIVENNLGNMILYPQAVPLTAEEMDFNLAVLREVLKLRCDEYYNKNFKRLLIPEYFLNRFPDLQKLAWAFIDVIKPQGLTTILLKSENFGTKNLGVLIKPEIVKNDGMIEITLSGKKYQIKIGSLITLPVGGNKVDIKLESQVAKLEGKEAVVLEVAGGQLGIIIDARF